MIGSRLKVCVFLLGCAARHTSGSWSRRTASLLPHPPQLVSARARARVSPRGPSCLSGVSRHGSGAAFPSLRATPGNQLRKRGADRLDESETVSRILLFFFSTHAQVRCKFHNKSRTSVWIYDVWYRQTTRSRQTSLIRDRSTVCRICRVGLQDTVLWCTIGTLLKYVRRGYFLKNTRKGGKIHPIFTQAHQIQSGSTVFQLEMHKLLIIKPILKLDERPPHAKLHVIHTLVK